MRHLKERGVTMVYISHRMDEIMEITDRITVMRDGEYVKTMNTAETTLDEIIHAMVGRTIYEEPKTVNMVPADAPGGAGGARSVFQRCAGYFLPAA